MHGITAVQVRRDLMLIGFSSDNKKGYNVSELIDFISSILDSAERNRRCCGGHGSFGYGHNVVFQRQTLQDAYSGRVR